jgi:uncharacterized membrane protein YphA (DoxX/SURF4 family)
MQTLDLIGWLAVRVALGYVYLLALYKNTVPAGAWKWTVDHTAYMFAKVPEPRRTSLAKLFAVAGMAMMLLGGLSVLLGIEGRLGALLLLVFTVGGVYSHKREREVAMELAQKVSPLVPSAGKDDFTTLQWSAFSGHYSSGLKNWALCGICVGIICWGTGPDSITISDRIIHLFY